MMADMNDEFPTVIGSDANFKGELTFDKGVRVNGHFEGQIKSKGTLHIAEGATVNANIDGANVRIEGECKGNLMVSEKLHLMATARMDGDVRTNRLEIADGAIYVGKVVVGQVSVESTVRRPTSAQPIPSGQPVPVSRDQGVSGHPPLAPGAPRPRPKDVRVPSGS